MSNNDYWDYLRCSQELYHHGILGQKWGIRRYQNKDGSLTPEGRKHYGLDLETESYIRAHAGNYMNPPKNTNINRSNQEKIANMYLKEYDRIVNDYGDFSEADHLFESLISDYADATIKDLKIDWLDDTTKARDYAERLFKKEFADMYISGILYKYGATTRYPETLTIAKKEINEILKKYDMEDMKKNNWGYLAPRNLYSNRK